MKTIWMLLIHTAAPSPHYEVDVQRGKEWGGEKRVAEITLHEKAKRAKEWSGDPSVDGLGQRWGEDRGGKPMKRPFEGQNKTYFIYKLKANKQCKRISGVGMPSLKSYTTLSLLHYVMLNGLLGFLRLMLHIKNDNR